MDELLARCEARLAELGISVKVGPFAPAGAGVQLAEARLARGAALQDYDLLVGPAVTFKDVAGLGAGHRPTLVFTTFVTAKTADAIRRAGVHYLDTAGNAWVTFGEVLLDVRGRPRPAHARTSARTAGNLFSTGRAQVVFALLAWPHLWNAPQREIAHVAGVSLGQAHNTLALLAEAGYGREVSRPGQTPLIDLWAAAFPTGLAQKLTLAAYRGGIQDVKSVGTDDALYVSGEIAAHDLLRPATLTLYVEYLDPRLPIVNRWRADGLANIVVRHKFWHTPDDYQTRGSGVSHAPWPLVYADLLASDDPRVRGVASEWRERFA